MGGDDRQDDALLTIPGLSEAEKMELVAMIGDSTGTARALANLGRYYEDLSIALDDDPAFRREYEMAIRLRDEEVEAALHRRAVKGNVPAIKFWLTNRRSTDWQETRTTRHVGHDGGAIEVEHTAAALREVLTSEETRDDAIAWIDAEDAELVEPAALPPGDRAAGPDQESDEAG